MLIHRIATLKETVAALAQLCPPEIYGPAPTSYEMQMAFTSLQVHYAEVALQLNQLLSSSSISFEYRTDVKQYDERRSALQWQIEREQRLIARLDIIIAEHTSLI
uniref:Mediator of RNA polymerase II transcription subunit 28 n=1 Tax=Ascaris lumbricoides TaxID=6252 RepID=A0A0M3IPC1_ASCLU